jgi:hypothetical protein
MLLPSSGYYLEDENNIFSEKDYNCPPEYRA